MGARPARDQRKTHLGERSRGALSELVHPARHRGVLGSADWKGQIDTFRGVYRERRDAMLAALGDYLPDLSWTHPTGGFYIWVTLPENLDSKSMLPRAVKELVAYTPGTAFYADGNGRSRMRLAFCYPTPDFIREGIRRLSTVINGELELQHVRADRAAHDRAARGDDDQPARQPRLRNHDRPALPASSFSPGASPRTGCLLRSGRRVADSLAEHGITVELRDPDASLLSYLRSSRPDVVWPALHGASGEDGALRGLLDFIGIPYVGSRAEASRLAWDNRPPRRSSVARA